MSLIHTSNRLAAIIFCTSICLPATAADPATEQPRNCHQPGTPVSLTEKRCDFEKSHPELVEYRSDRIVVHLPSGQDMTLARHEEVEYLPLELLLDGRFLLLESIAWGEFGSYDLVDLEQNRLYDIEGRPLINREGTLLVAMGSSMSRSHGRPVLRLYRITDTSLTLLHDATPAKHQRWVPQGGEWQSGDTFHFHKAWFNPDPEPTDFTYLIQPAALHRSNSGWRTLETGKKRKARHLP